MEKLSEGFPIELQNAYILGHQHCMQVVSLLPAADVVERKTGKWKRKIVDNGFNADWVCSECGYRVMSDFISFNFCPNCGARMVTDDV